MPGLPNDVLPVPRRSTALVPGHVARMMEKAHEFAADILVLDLEDSVPFVDAEKRQARSAVTAALSAGGFRAREISVRVNGPRTPWFAEDVSAALDAGALALTLPHVHGLADVLFAEERIAAVAKRPVAVHLSVETPGLLLDLEAVARESRFVVSLSVAPNDYCLETGSTALLQALMAGKPGVAVDEQLVWLRQKLIAVAKARGWSAIDAPAIADPDDAAAARAAMAHSRAMGFDGAAVLYPRFIDLANEVFSPAPDELAWARQVAADFDRMQADPAAAGRKVMRQHHETAVRLLRMASAIGSKHV